MADTETCKPGRATCEERGLMNADWFSSFHLRLCQALAWLGRIANLLAVAPYGKQAIVPTIYGFNAQGSVKTIVVPAGAISIHAQIDNEYAADYRLTVKQGAGTEYPMPAGTDFHLEAITPVYQADEDGTNPTVGYGFYPQFTFKYPAGSRGFVTATYRGVAQAFTITN